MIKNFFKKSNNKIKSFISADDLDEAMNAFRQLGKLNEDDLKLVENVIEEWTNIQAISNILMYPVLIEKSRRVEILLKGLRSEDIPYYSLASIIGFQKSDLMDLNEESRKIIVEELIQIANKYTNFSDRVVVTLEKYLKIEDAEKLCNLIHINNKTTRHNIIAWLLKSFKGKKEDLTDLIKKCKISKEFKDLVSNKYSENERKITQGIYSDLEFMLYSYLPNLKDFEN